MCLQETRSRRSWKRSCFQKADMTIIRLSSLQQVFLTLSLALHSACCIVSPPHPSFLSKWRSHSISLQPATGWLHLLFSQKGFMCYLSAGLRGFYEAEMLLFCVLEAWFYTPTDLSVIMLLYCAAFYKVPYPYMRGPGSWRSHDLFIPLNNQELKLSNYYLCNFWL